MSKIWLNSKVRTVVHGKDLFMTTATGKVLKKKRPYMVSKGTIGTVTRIYDFGQEYQIEFDNLMIILNKECIELVGEVK